ncbi:hypothetical protein U1Q18_030211 [Sarracenia purpurea var. burkii]
MQLHRFDERKHSLLWDVEPNNVDFHPPPQSITLRGRNNDDKPIDKGKLITSQAAFHVESGDGERASLIRSPKSSVGIMPVFGSSHSVSFRAGGNMEEMHKSEGGLVLHINQNEENNSNNDGKDLLRPDNIQMASVAETGGNNEDSEIQRTRDFLPLRTHDPETGMEQTKASSGECNEVIMVDPSARIRDVASGNQSRGLANELQNAKHCEPDSPVPNLISPGGQLGKLSIDFEEKIKYKTKIDGSTSIPPLEKMESTAENNLHLLIGKDACGRSEERLIPRDKSVALEASPTNSGIHLCRRKGKETALSDEGVNKQMSKDDDYSHESIESCNSVGLFSMGKKRWGDEQPLIVGSKRVKKQIQESLASTSFVRQNSSFMNWISNMVKGLNKSNQDEASTLALTFAHPNHGHTSHDQEMITYDRNQDPVSKNEGFQTIFRSLYCSNPKEQEIRMSNAVNVTPIACHGENDGLSNQFFESNKKFNVSAYGYEAGPSVKPKTSSAILVTATGIHEMISSENKIACNVAYSEVKDGISSSFSSLDRHKTQCAENHSSNPDEGKVVDNVGYGSGPCRSLWITRFYPKTPRPFVNLFHCRQNSSDKEAKDYSTEYPVNVVGKELQSYATSTEPSIDLKKIHGRTDEKSLYKLNPVVPFPKPKSSEAMASLFARRLDALKHIKPSDVKDDLNHALTTCFYCGRSGHDLCDCREIIESERDNAVISTDKRISNSNEVQKLIASNPGDNVLKEKHIGSLYNLVDKKSSDVPKGVFDAIRKLRLTRMDILKWMNSATSLSHLDGFFLRLRIGKWEGGLWLTGCHVAHITGEQKEISSQGQKTPISVNIGGRRFFVGSQYISNQDFCEDELMAWWRSTLTSGGKVPSEDHFKMKLEMRKRIGF